VKLNEQFVFIDVGIASDREGSTRSFGQDCRNLAKKVIGRMLCKPRKIQKDCVNFVARMSKVREGKAGDFLQDEFLQRAMAELDG